MKAKIKSEQRFTITTSIPGGIGGIHKGCIKESEWEGLTAFRTPDGFKIIVKTEDGFAQILSQVFAGKGFGDEKEVNAEIVLISPNLVNP